MRKGLQSSTVRKSSKKVEEEMGEQKMLRKVKRRQKAKRQKLLRVGEHVEMLLG